MEVEAFCKVFYIIKIPLMGPGNNVEVISKWRTNHFGIFIQLVLKGMIIEERRNAKSLSAVVWK